MVVVRDPETGKFVSADGDRGAYDTDEPEVYSGRVAYNVDAADLTTGSEFFDVSGSDATAIDFGEDLSSDEVFVPHYIELHTQLSAGRTATAEHVYLAEYTLRSGPDEAVGILGDQEVAQDGAVNIYNEQSDEDDVIFNGVLAGGGDFADSSTGLAAGGSYTHADHDLSYPDVELNAHGYDNDDQLALPTTFVVNGSDDQSFTFEAAVTVIGTTYDY